MISYHDIRHAPRRAHHNEISGGGMQALTSQPPNNLRPKILVDYHVRNHNEPTRGRGKSRARICGMRIKRREKQLIES